MDMMMTFKDSTAAAGASAHHHQQEATGTTVEEARKVKQAGASGGEERKPRPQLEEALRCPRCDSSNTKFCYYNNHSMLQPRYFCKACRRYWTQGGSLRNVPVGGGCRKNKRSSATVLPSSNSVPAEQNFPNVLPTFMSTGFDIPFPPLSLSSLASAPPLPSGDGTPSFLDMLGGGFLDYQGNGFYGPASSTTETPSFGFGAIMQNGVVGGHGSAAPIGAEDAAASTTHGGNQQHEGESVPDTATANNPWRGG